MDNSKVYAMKLSKVYPLLVAKAERKGRSKAEVDEVIFWLTGYDAVGFQRCLEMDADYGTFFREAPQMHKTRHLITGSICGVKLQEIKDPLMRDIRCLDKLVDELTKGKPMEKILRK